MTGLVLAAGTRSSWLISKLFTPSSDDLNGTVTITRVRAACSSACVVAVCVGVLGSPQAGEVVMDLCRRGEVILRLLVTALPPKRPRPTLHRRGVRGGQNNVPGPGVAEHVCQHGAGRGMQVQVGLVCPFTNDIVNPANYARSLL